MSLKNNIDLRDQHQHKLLHMVNAINDLHIQLCMPKVRSGDISFNVENIIYCAEKAYQSGAKLVIFSELAITGYNIKDQIWSSEFLHQLKDATQKICDITAQWPGCSLLLGNIGFDDEFSLRAQILSEVLDPKSISENENENENENESEMEGAGTIANRRELLDQLMQNIDEVHQFIDIDRLIPLDAHDECSAMHPMGGAKPKMYNVAQCFAGGKEVYRYVKKQLANYGVFDEKRYYNPRRESPDILSVQGVNFAVMICEDLWTESVATEYLSLYPEIHGFIVLNASPYHIAKKSQRLDLVRQLAKKSGKSVLYLNQYGGQNELIFDGEYIVCNTQGGPILCGCAQSLSDKHDANISVNYVGLLTAYEAANNVASHDDASDLYHALMLGVYSYFQDKKIHKALIGLSGGIDSALVAILASDVLGAHNVICVQLPTCYTSKDSFADSAYLAERLGCQLHNMSIEAVRKLCERELIDSMSLDISGGIAAENIQARIRGVLLMAISNQTGAMLLATSNKSESAVGYATIYGDMCGGLAPIADLYKTQVYALSAWRNANIPVHSRCCLKNLLSPNVFLKEPSAELRENQEDIDSLPDYLTLDKILYCLLEKNMSHLEIAHILGVNLDIIEDISTKIAKSEFKRNQAACSIKINRSALRYDRRFNS